MEKGTWQTYNRNYILQAVNQAYQEMAKNLDEELTAIKGISGLKQQATAISEAESKEYLSNLEILVTNCGLSEFEQNILLICAGVQLNDTYGKQLAKWQGEKLGCNPFRGLIGKKRIKEGSSHPSFGFLLKGLANPHLEAIAAGAPLLRYNLVHRLENGMLTNSILKIDESILLYLLGINQLSKSLESLVSRVTAPFLLSEQQATYIEQVAKAITERDNMPLPTVRLKGPNHRTAARAVSQQFGLELYRLQPAAIANIGDELGRITQLWNRDAAIKGYSLYVDLDRSDMSEGVKNNLEAFIAKISGLVFKHGGNQSESSVMEELMLELPNPTREEQVKHWERALQLPAREFESTLEEVVDFFDMDYVSIEAIAGKNRTTTKPDTLKGDTALKGLKETIWQSCRERTNLALDDLAYKIDVKASWDDIVLIPEHMAMLKEITHQVRHRHTVYQEWKFSEKYSRGLGISALFTGESGTGKTMAAEVIANELQLALYRVDLSQVVNKYIGETEKNIKKIFDAAEDSGVILLFDEADALFGKRSEVTTSNDRYSNIQLGYLLQRMEEYTGLAILTTNMKQSIDKAFERRIRFTIHFERPDIQLRKAIWKRMFPAAAKINGLDYDKLAQLNVAGGNIRNIALNAAFQAAAAGNSIGMKNILHATKMEYNKMEKTLSRNEIKDWV